jgi:hypothetical protein
MSKNPFVSLTTLYAMGISMWEIYRQDDDMIEVIESGVRPDIDRRRYGRRACRVSGDRSLHESLSP